MHPAPFPSVLSLHLGQELHHPILSVYLISTIIITNTHHVTISIITITILITTTTFSIVIFPRFIIISIHRHHRCQIMTIAFSVLTYLITIFITITIVIITIVAIRTHTVPGTVLRQQVFYLIESSQYPRSRCQNYPPVLQKGKPRLRGKELAQSQSQEVPEGVLKLKLPDTRAQS